MSFVLPMMGMAMTVSYTHRTPESSSSSKDTTSSKGGRGIQGDGDHSYAHLRAESPLADVCAEYASLALSLSSSITPKQSFSHPFFAAPSSILLPPAHLQPSRARSIAQARVPVALSHPDPRARNCAPWGPRSVR